MNTRAPKKTAEAQASLLYSLILVGNHEYLEDMSYLSPANIKFYGVRLPVLRATMKTWLDQSELNFDERRRIVQMLWESGSREERLIALWMVSEENDLLTAVTWNEILVWSGSPDNWEVADVLAMRILAPWIIKDLAERLKYLDTLVAENNYWRRSISISAATFLHRLEPSLEEKTIGMMEKILPDHHPIVIKAVRLALIELGKRNPNRLSLFILKNRKDLSTHLLNEVERETRKG